MTSHHNQKLIHNFRQALDSLTELHTTLLSRDDVFGAELVREDIQKYKSWLNSILKDL